jgi:hypothetical protein
VTEHDEPQGGTRPPQVPDEFPKRDRKADDESVNARFRPRR